LTKEHLKNTKEKLKKKTEKHGMDLVKISVLFSLHCDENGKLFLVCPCSTGLLLEWVSGVGGRILFSSSTSLTETICNGAIHMATGSATAMLG